MKKILILITTLLFLQGCSSNKSYTNDQLQNLTNSVQINQLEKTEFDTKNNKLIITTKDEVINEEDFKSILKSLKINSFKGEQLSYNNLTSEKFDNKEYQTTEKEAYELVFHVVWGLQSLERESKEEYNIHDYLEKWLLKPLNFKISSIIEEKDGSYLQYLQKYFKLKEVPFYTKCILILEKEEI